MASRKISGFRKKRNLKPKRIILIKVEGKNVTEKQHFINYNDVSNDYRVILARGNTTDPVSMVMALKNDMDKNDFNKSNGDKAFCVFDTDDDERKNKQIEDAKKLADIYGIEIIVSSPSFEEWILCHFENSTSFINNRDIVKKVNEYIPYKKTIDVFDDIKHLTDKAIKNAKFKEKYHKNLNHNLYSTEANPSSMVYKIIEELKNK